ncbi:MAG: MBL fold metallo-hydrolase [Clostridia bacterium]|nr:MBL fold metallo-hydrolase [Clostridia bacterium]
MSRLIQIMTQGSKFDGEFKWQAAGMSYLIINDNHEYAIVDGGQYLEDIEELYRLMRDDCGKDVVTVKYWFITHPHGDHFWALYNMAQSGEYMQKIKVEKLLFSIPEKFERCAKELAQLNSLPGILGAEFIEPSGDDVYEFGDLTFEVYLTYKDIGNPSDPNELSMLFSVKGKNKKAMFVGDAYAAGCASAVRRLKEEGRLDALKSDIIQIAHHGLNGGDLDFYYYVGAYIAMVPISKSGYLAINEPWHRWATPNRFAQDHALTVIYAFEGNFAVEI